MQCFSIVAQDDVDEGSHIAHIDHAVAVEVAHGVAIAGSAQHAVDEGGDVGHVHLAVGVDVAGGCSRVADDNLACHFIAVLSYNLMFLSIENCTSRVNYAAILESELFKVIGRITIACNLCRYAGIINGKIGVPYSFTKS